ncbi:hypothetical protein [Deinococcus pimensis]|uniref:hypothetical protein n=1 Tax=Deinococcus pimensis TaxID=309888 RepID=UPI0004AFAECA|nr:hypothetical protein [Deinococcus pimensis]
MTSRQDARDDSTTDRLTDEGNQERDASPGAMGEDALTGAHHPAFERDEQDGAASEALPGGADEAGESGR